MCAPERYNWRVPPDALRARILLVAQDFPWPVTGGSLQRLGHVIGTLAELGDVDLFALVHPYRTEELVAPRGAPVRRWTKTVMPAPDLRLARRAAWLASGLPLELANRDFTRVRQDLSDWADQRYDLVWVSKLASWHAVGGPPLGPTVLDLDDLEARRVRATFAAGAAGPQRGGRTRGHLAAARAQNTLSARRWDRLQRRAARSVARTALCSDLDIRRSGLANAVRVGNGYPVPPVALGERAPAAAPRILFAGVQYYPPNADAAAWLANEIAPRIRSVLPEVEIRLVGEVHPPGRALDDPPRVHVVGRVAQMDDELARADLIAVPLRSGSGTRVKVLEGFAHRIPVVATTVGAEGLGARDGTHLLLADDAESFARACVLLLSDHTLRRQLTTAAHELFRRHHTADITRADVRTVATAVLGSS